VKIDATLPDWLAKEPLKHIPRLILKGCFFALGMYALFAVSWPTQAKSWGLWITDKTLASATALLLTLAAATIIGVSGAAKAGGRWFTAFLGLVLGVGIYALTLGAAWNFYLHESTKNGTAVLEASQRVNSASEARIAELNEQLADLRKRETETVAPLDARIATLPPGPSLRQLTATRNEAAKRIADERAPLTEELNKLRARETQVDSGQNIVNTTPVDARPLDVELGILVGVPRTFIGSMLDFIRSAIVEAFLVLFLPLVLSDRPPPVEAKRRRFKRLFDAIIDASIDSAMARLPKRLAEPPPPTFRNATETEAFWFVALAKEVGRGHVWDAPFSLVTLIVEIAQLVKAKQPKQDAPEPDKTPPLPPIPEPPAVDPPTGKATIPPRPNKGLPRPTPEELAAARKSGESLAA
jgi:hypothetical protein